MATFISHDELMGQAQAPDAKQFLTQEEASGIPEPDPTTTWQKLRAKQYSLSAVAERARVGQPERYGRDHMPLEKPPLTPLQSVAGMGAQVVDMAVGIVNQAIGVTAYPTAYIGERLKGQEPPAAAKYARELATTGILPEWARAPWGRVARAMGEEADRAYNENPVAWVMGKLGEFIEEGALKAGDKTQAPSEHFMYLADSVMGILGAKGAARPVREAYQLRKAQWEGKAPLQGPPKPTEGQQVHAAENARKAIRESEARIAAMQESMDPTLSLPPEPTKAEIKAHEKRVAEIVVDEKKLKSIMGIAKKAGPEAEALLVQNIFDRVLRPQSRVEVPPVARTVPERTIGAEAGQVLKTRIAEPTIIGQAAPDNTLNMALDKLRRGLLLTKDEAKAVRRLTPRVGEGVIVDEAGKPLFQRGRADPSLLKVLGVMGLGAVAAKQIYDWWTAGELSEDNVRDIGLAAAGGAGVIKGKGGMWHPEAVTKLAAPLAESLFTLPPDVPFVGRGSPAEAKYMEPGKTWSENAVRNYLNRHAGTATDPIKDLRLPDGTKWEDLTDKAFRKNRVGTQELADAGGLDLNEYSPKEIPGAKVGETVWSTHSAFGDAAARLSELTSYLSHVGDYLRSLNLPPEKLQQYDLTRAIRETVANDERIAKAALKDFTQPNPTRIADTNSLPLYKSYEAVQQGPRKFSFNKDGSIRQMEEITLPAGEVAYQWREIALPKRLTPEQLKRVRPATRDEARNIADTDPDYIEGEWADQDFGYVALDAKGKPIVDNFSKSIAGGATPENAWLAGRLAEEGNSLGHCVGGYCAAVLDGSTKIYSLRDQSGRSYATVEVEPKRKAGTYTTHYEDDIAQQGVSDKPANILQIKGPGNGAPADYVLPYIQDFVKSGKWGRVEDLYNTGGLIKFRGEYVFEADLQPLRKSALEFLEKHPSFAKHRETAKALDEYRGPIPSEEYTAVQRAGTQPVHRDIPYTLQELRNLIEQPEAFVYGNESAGEVLARSLDIVNKLRHKLAGIEPQRGAAKPEHLAAIAAASGAAAYALSDDPDKWQNLALLGAAGTMKGLGEAKLIETFRKGGKEGEKAFAQIYTDNIKQLERSIRNMGRDLPVEDIAQRTMEKLARKLVIPADQEGAFRGESKLSTYLHAIARNEANNAFRDEKARPAMESTALGERFDEQGEFINPERDLIDESGKTPEVALEQQQMIAAAQRALDRLDPDQRKVFELSELEGLSDQAIADQLGIPIGTMKSRLNRARTQLQLNLAGYRGQRGGADPRTLAGVGLTAAGAAVGAMMTEEGQAIAGPTITGGLLGFGAAVLGAQVKNIDRLVGRSSTRLGNYDPTFVTAMRRMEGDAQRALGEASAQIHDFIKVASKLPKEVYKVFDQAYMENAPEKIAAILRGNPELAQAYTKVRQFLDKTGDDLKGLGRFQKGITEYLPRVVKDYKGLMEALGGEAQGALEKLMAQANQRSIKLRGRELTDVERSVLMNNWLKSEPGMSALPGFAKRRSVEMTEALRPFYHSMEESLVRYAHAAVEDLNVAKFFGKDLRTTKEGNHVYTNVLDSIGAMVDRAIVDKRLTHEQAVEVREILRARFGNGQKAPMELLQDVRNLTGLALLGQISSGLIQTSEALLSGYHHGVVPALQSAATVLTGRGIKPAEFGLANHVIEETINKRPTGVALSTVLKANLLAQMDQLGMRQNLTASFIKNKALVQSPTGIVKFTQRWAPYYGKDLPQLIADLKNATTTNRSQLVDGLLYQELSDIRPTSRIEMPEVYNSNPNLRFMWQFKQFMLTQGDIIRRDGYNKIKSGVLNKRPMEVAEGVKNIVTYAAALSVVTIPSDWIKNWILGRDFDFDKIDYLDNLLRNFGLGRYDLDKVQYSNKAFSAGWDVAKKYVTPPAVGMADSIVQGAAEPEKLVRHIPVVGTTIYNRALGGNEDYEARKKREERLRMRNELEAKYPALKAARLARQEAAKRKKEAK